jgi:hypothetical protein
MHCVLCAPVLAKRSGSLLLTTRVSGFLWWTAVGCALAALPPGFSHAMSDSIDFVPAVRLLNGPKIVSITTEEEKAAVIASGIDELAAQGRHVGASGWSGPGGRSAGSGIALKRFDGVADTESITSLLPKQAAVGGVRRGGAAGGSPAGTSKLPRPVSGPSVHSRVLASDDRADVAVARPGGAPDRRAPVVRASSFHSGPRSGVPTSVSPNLVVGSSEPSSRTPAHGRRATDSKGSSGIASGAGSTGPRAMSAGKSAPETISPTSGRLPKAGRRAVSARTLATDEAPEPSPPQPARTLICLVAAVLLCSLPRPVG